VARWGGIAAILGGVLELAVATFVPRFGPPSLTMGDPVLYEAAILLGIVGSPLLALGLAGLCARIAQRPGEPLPTKGLAILGLILAGLASLLPLIVVLQLMVAGKILIPPQSFFLETLLPLELWGLPVATALLGVAALWSGALGHWSPLPLAIGMLMLFGIPYVVLGPLWVLLGCVMVWMSREQSVPQPARVC